MSKYIIIPAVTLLLLFVACACFGADEQSFSISRDIKYDNYPVRVVVNSKTGDVLVAWMNIVNPDTKRIYVALCKLSKSGKFKVKKARMLTGADSFVCYFDIEYNPLDNSYLAVCDAYEEGYGSPINIFSLKLNSKGRPVGSPKQLTPKGTKYLCPVICFVPGIPVAPPNGKGNYLMAYTYLAPLLEADKAGVYTTFLEYDGDMTASVPRLVSAPLIDWKGFVGLESLPVKLIAMSDGGFMMTLRKSTGAFLMNSFLLRLGQFGQAIKQVPLCDYASTLVEFVQLSQRICVASWDRYETGYMECYIQLFRPTLKKVRKLSIPWTMTKPLSPS